jgi:hypothetical protein
MSFPASGERFGLAIKSPGADMPGTLLTSRTASDFAVNTDSPDALQFCPSTFWGVSAPGIQIAHVWSSNRSPR